MMKVAVWGDSSGGHTAVMTGLTWQKHELDTELLSEYTIDHIGPGSPEDMLIGGLNVLENLDKAAPSFLQKCLS